MMTSAQTQRGFALITAVLLITALLTVAVVSAWLLTQRGVATARGLEAVRAHYAARAAAEAGAVQALAGGCAAVPAAPDPVQGFTVTLGCVAHTVDEAGQSYLIYRLRAEASRGRIEAGTLVRRVVELSVVDAP